MEPILDRCATHELKTEASHSAAVREAMEQSQIAIARTRYALEISRRLLDNEQHNDALEK
jgi:hypothetical protein